MNYNYLVRKTNVYNNIDFNNNGIEMSYITFDIEKEHKALCDYFIFGWESAFAAHDRSLDFMKQLCLLLTHGYMEDD